MKNILGVLMVLITFNSNADVSNLTGHSTLRMNSYNENNRDFLEFEYCQAGS